MKKRIFSLKLYLEGIRQTKIIGIMTFVILAIQAVAIPLGQAIDNWSNDYVGVSRGVEFTEVNPFLFAVIYVVAPLLALSLFSFLNKRQSSDFYHSMADTRICLFLSFFAAICTWIVTLCLSSTLIAVITHNIFPQYFTLNYVNIWLTMFNIIASSLYCVSAVTLAMTLTGTLVTNIAVTGLILILPDYLLFMIDNMVISEVPIMRYNNSLGDILPNGFNFMSSLSVDFTNIGDAVYTLIFAVILSGIALIIFNFRKSESAGYPALNKYMQTAIRITFCMVVCIFACGGIFNLMNDMYSFTSSDIFVLVLIYIAALIVYFLYELITTKKLKNIPKTIPALLIVVVLNIGCVIGMNAMYNSYLSFEPSASEIDYIKVEQTDDYIYDLSEYLELKSSKIKLKDTEIKEIISAVLSENIKKVRNDTFYDNYSNTLTVNICVNGMEHNRYLSLSDEDFNTILAALKNSEDFKKSYTTLPDANSVSIDTYGMSKDISNKDARRLYNILRKEVAEYSFEEWYMINQGAVDVSNVCDINITVIDGTDTYDLYVPLYSVFQEATNEYFKLSYSEEDSDMILQLLKNPDELDSMELEVYNSNTGYHHYYYYGEDDVLDSEDLMEIADYLEPAVNITPDDTYIRICAYKELENGYDENSKNYSYEIEEYFSYFKFTGDIIEIIK